MTYIIVISILAILTLFYGCTRVLSSLPIEEAIIDTKNVKKVYKDNIAKQFLDQFENEYLLYNKRNTSKFVMQKLIGIEPHYIFRIRESDLKNKNIDNKGYALYTMTRELITLIKNKGYNFVYYDFPDISKAKNPTIIKITVKI